MKARGIIGPILFLVAGLFGWHSILPTAPARQTVNPGQLRLNAVWGKRYFDGPDVRARMIVENDTTEVSGRGVSQSASGSRFDPFFIQANDFRQVLIPATHSKLEQQAIVLAL